MFESGTNAVVVIDATVETFKALLYTLYTARLPDHLTEVPKLIELRTLAHMYVLETIEHIAVDAIITRLINVDAAFQVLYTVFSPTALDPPGLHRDIIQKAHLIVSSSNATDVMEGFKFVSFAAVVDLLDEECATSFSAAEFLDLVNVVGGGR